MIYKTLEGMLSPDGKLTLPPDTLPHHPTRVMVTLVEADEESSFSEPGDYLENLTDYEESLARGEIQWQ